MLKSDLIKKLSSIHDQRSPKSIHEGVNLLIQTMVDHLIDQNRIEIRELGCFFCVQQQPRKARNPRTGEKVLTSAKTKARFKMGKTLLNRLNEANKVDAGVVQW